MLRRDQRQRSFNFVGVKTIYESFMAGSYSAANIEERKDVSVSPYVLQPQ